MKVEFSIVYLFVLTRVLYWCVARQPELLRADSAVFAERSLVCCSREIQLAIVEK